MNMKKNKRKFAMIFFGVILPIVLFVLIFILDSRYADSLRDEYKNIEYRDELNGIIESMKTRKGGVYLILENDMKVRFYPSHNYLYKKPNIDGFLNKGDKLFKPKNSDTLYVFRNGRKYYFVLGEFINK